jgi:hypothetical protein
MAQADYYIANQSGALVRQDLNEQFEAIATLNAGPDEPAVKFPHMLWKCTTTGVLYQRNAGNTAWELFGELNGGVPVGTVVAYVPGYFADAANGGFVVTGPAANTVAAVNALVGPTWRVADGSEYEDPASPIWSSSGRHLPNCSNSRFMMGSTTAGGIGGATTHTHTTGDFTLTTSHIPSHNHSITVNSGGNHRHPVYSEGGGSVQHNTLKPSNPGENTEYTQYGGAHSHTATCGNIGGGAAHNHGATGSSGHMPPYLSCFYLVRVR